MANGKELSTSPRIPLGKFLCAQTPWYKIEVNPDLRPGFLMYSELRRKAMQNMTISSHCVELMMCGITLVIYLKWSTMFSTKYSGRHLNTSGCSSGNGIFIDCLGNSTCDTSRQSQTMTYLMSDIPRPCMISSCRMPCVATTIHLVCSTCFLASASRRSNNASAAGLVAYCGLCASN